MDERTMTTVPVRHWGRWITGAVVLVLLAALVYAFSQADIQYDATLRFLTVLTILQGMAGTLLISIAAQSLGIVLGVVTAIMRLSANPVADRVVFMDGGIVVEEGPAAEVIERPQHARTREFLGKVR